MTTIAIITAMDCEYEAIYSLYDFKTTSGLAKVNIYDKTVYLIKSGIGKVNAALATNLAIQKGADIVITTGLAGGIDDCLSQGDIVLADKTCYHDVWCGSPNLKGQVQDFPLYFDLSLKLKELLHPVAESKGWKIGLTVTGDQFLTDAEALKQIKTDFESALAVDMESASVAQTCYLNNKPYISLRIISDVVGKENQVEQYNTFWENIPRCASEMVDEILKSLSLK